eukprot:1175502-Heterocapsa_arctica.AAC.1
MQERFTPSLQMEYGTRKEQIREDKMTMGYVCYANAGRKDDYNKFGGNAKPVTRSQIITGCNFKISRNI